MPAPRFSRPGALGPATPAISDRVGMAEAMPHIRRLATAKLVAAYASSAGAEASTDRLAKSNGTPGPMVELSVIFLR